MWDARAPLWIRDTGKVKGPLDYKWNIHLNKIQRYILKDHNYTSWVHQVTKAGERQSLNVQHWTLRMVCCKFSIYGGCYSYYHILLFIIITIIINSISRRGTCLTQRDWNPIKLLKVHRVVSLAHGNRNRNNEERSQTLQSHSWLQGTLGFILYRHRDNLKNVHEIRSAFMKDWGWEPAWRLRPSPKRGIMLFWTE